MGLGRVTYFEKILIARGSLKDRLSEWEKKLHRTRFSTGVSHGPGRSPGEDKP